MPSCHWFAHEHYMYPRYEEAVICLSKEIEFYAAAENYAMISKLVLGVVLLKLTLGDYVAAEQFYRSASRYVVPGYVNGGF